MYGTCAASISHQTRRVARVVRQEEKISCKFNVQRLSKSEVKRAFGGELQARALQIPGSTVEKAFVATGENTLGRLTLIRDLGQIHSVFR